MSTEGFSGYVEPGGLTDRVKIRLLICFIMDKLNLPVSAQTVSDIILDQGLANYFEVSAAIGDLVEAESIVPVPGFSPVHYILTHKGTASVQRIVTDLPLSVRDKALESADRLVIRRIDQEENKVTVTQTGDGYTVTIRMTDIGSDLLQMTLYVPDREAADRVTENFFRNPPGLYSGVLKLLVN